MLAPCEMAPAGEHLRHRYSSRSLVAGHVAMRVPCPPPVSERAAGCPRATAPGPFATARRGRPSAGAREAGAERVGAKGDLRSAERSPEPTNRATTAAPSAGSGCALDGAPSVGSRTTIATTPPGRRYFFALTHHRTGCANSWKACTMTMRWRSIPGHTPMASIARSMSRPQSSAGPPPAVWPGPSQGPRSRRTQPTALGASPPPCSRIQPTRARIPTPMALGTDLEVRCVYSSRSRPSSSPRAMRQAGIPPARRTVTKGTSTPTQTATGSMFSPGMTEALAVCINVQPKPTPAATPSAATMTCHRIM